MDIINLENVADLPDELLHELNKFDNIFLEYTCIDHIEQIPDIKSLIIGINSFCLENMIVGYHYTRAF